MRRFIGAALIVAAASALVACRTSTPPQPSPSASVSTGVHGIVLTNRGGYVVSSTPVALPGGFGTVIDRYPYRGAPVVIKRARADGTLEVVVRLHADANGLFSCALPPGKYIAVCPAPSAGKTPVIVRQGHISRIRVEGGIKF